MPAASDITVSVIIPTHDRPDMLRTAIESVLAQSFVGGLEVIIVDDGSEPPASLPEYAGAVRILRNDASIGVSRARNLGIASARGRYVAFLDDDDRWHPDKLSSQIAALQDHSARWSFTGCHQVHADGASDRPFRPEQIAGAVADIEQDNRIGTPSSVVVERGLLDEVGGFDASLAVLADWEMWIRLARAARAAPVPRPLVDYVVHDGGMHRAKLSAGLRERRVIARRHNIRGGLGGLSYWMWVARSLRGNGKPISAVVVATVAVARRPRTAAARARGSWSRRRRSRSG